MSQKKVSMALFLIVNLLFSTATADYGSGGGTGGVGLPGVSIGTSPTPTVPVPSPTTPGLPSTPVGLPTTPVGGLPSTPVGGFPSTPVGGLPTVPVGGLPNVPVGGLPTLPNPGGLLGGLTCPIDVLKLSVCANVLSGLLHVGVGLGGALGGLLGGGNQRCCSLVAGLADLDAAVCLCTAIRANVLGINLNVPLSLSLLLNDCGKNLPGGFLCPAI